MMYQPFRNSAGKNALARDHTVSSKTNISISETSQILRKTFIVVCV